MILKARNSKINIIYAYLIFMVWPMLSAFMALLNYRSKYSKNIIWLFCAFFGYTFIISDPYMDANRYKSWLVEMHKKSDEPYVKLFVEPYKDKGIYAGTDIYSHVLTLTASRFTDDFRLFFALIGLIFGYFYSRNLFLLLSHIKDKKLIFLSVIFIVSLALLMPFWNINGYRFYTAAMIFLYGALKIIYEKKYRYFWVALLSPLVHFSFGLPVVVLLLYLLLGNRIWIYTFILVGSLFLVDVSPKTVNENAELAPLFMQNKVKGYSSEDYVKLIQRTQSDMNWYVRGHMYAIQFCIYTMILLVFFFRKKFISNHISESLICLGILMLAMANSVSSIPSMGRFFTIAAFILISGFIHIIQEHPKEKLFRLLGFVYLIPLLIFIIVEIRIGFDFIGLNSIFLNPMIAPFFKDSPSLIEFIK
ncbi:MAG: EpsG family protein [Saprospiraceae bacterium]|nr:EpsG family protein [Saprospiraceae bacterium]